MNIATQNVLAQSRGGTYPHIDYKITMSGMLALPSQVITSQLNRNIASALNDVIGRGYTDIKRGIPRRTTLVERIHGGSEHLRDTIKLDKAMIATDSARVSTDSPIMIFVENDTRPHEIRAVNAQALRFQSGGRTIFAKSVQHPGTRGKHLWSRADAAIRQRLIRAVDAAMTATFQGVNYVRRYWNGRT